MTNRKEQCFTLLLAATALGSWMYLCVWLGEDITSKNDKLDKIRHIRSLPQASCVLVLPFTHTIRDGKGYVPVEYRDQDKTSLIPTTLFFPSIGTTSEKRLDEWFFSLSLEFPCWIYSNEYVIDRQYSGWEKDDLEKDRDARVVLLVLVSIVTFFLTVAFCVFLVNYIESERDTLSSRIRDVLDNYEREPHQDEPHQDEPRQVEPRQVEPRQEPRPFPRPDEICTLNDFEA